ncbi:subtilisin-like protease SBT1.3 [Macadamia integrifolia]|uniref:subtilisin-like protease SBT1.3 n=1 Tax=Macadamia integrifolia TaxID=60698 RepID=UPI001C4F8A5B|nr:subtilisin-like protease SBT1.3 [Macadamia integrifolia]
MALSGNILAAWIPNQPVNPKDPTMETFQIEFGTSISFSYVATVTTLLPSTHPTWSLATIRSAMLTTSSILNNYDRPIVRNNDYESQTPLAFGTGHVNPQRALDPGLIYDADVDDYPGNLNYPSIPTLFSHERRIQVLKRTLTNVAEETPETYTVKVISPKSNKVAIRVIPKKLTFKKIYQKYSYEVKLKSKFNGTTDVEYAYIVWESENHFVRILVVFMWRNL